MELVMIKRPVEDAVDGNRNQLRLVVEIPWFTKGFINPRWLVLGFLNDQQYERKDSRNKNKKYNTDLLKKPWRLI